MKFSLLLFALGLKLRITAMFSKAFRKRVRRKDFSLTIQASDSGRSRTFYLKRGRIRSTGRKNRQTDTELLWCDAKTAVRVMLSKNDLDGFSAIGRRDLRIFGDFENALLFMDLAQ
ncbi:hypothetical protein [uncultured Desulfosarcina sp.]|uniref:hypothetical protein n=1 Tax=uncultured Desulfosarcina sp. TaxID=218289 RepID=UPI0029C6FD46|nr:hypothetical protein [uncultured Desulfosarcina sp.]